MVIKLLKRQLVRINTWRSGHFLFVKREMLMENCTVCIITFLDFEIDRFLYKRRTYGSRTITWEMLPNDTFTIFI